MHPPHIRERAWKLHAAGVPFGEICRDLGIPRSTVGDWLHGERGRQAVERGVRQRRCPRCADPPRDPDDAAAYAYLLGLYLGDGYLVTTARVPVLRIYCANAWPGLIEQCELAMRAVIATSVHRVRKPGCVTVQSYSAHWPCLFPQYGPGRKHERAISLAAWQRPIVQDHPGDLLRGLFHSDGCRVTNRVRVRQHAYEYPRYMFVNESADIMRFCQEALDRLGISWRMTRRNTLSVARREAVAALDEHVGPKW